MDSNIDDKGIYTLPDGTEYHKDSTNHKFQGKGTKTYPDGTKYEGDFVNDKLNGKGTYTGSLKHKPA